MKGLGLAFMTLVATLLSGGAHAQGLGPISKIVPNSAPQVQLSYAPVVKATAPAVVNIYTQKIVRQRVFSPFLNDPFFQHFFGGGLPQGTRQRLENSLGSGVFVRPDGLIVTNNHVINGADEITVVLHDRREFAAQLVTTDERTDLAILKIDTRGEKMPFLEMKDSDDVEVGDLVLAIGNPFGVGQSVTNGIVSALARTNLDINDINYYIQTDAPINPGNSGGALVGMDGKLIGINTAIYSRDGGNMGIGFAIPANMVRATVAGIVEGGKGAVPRRLARPWTGIETQEVTPDMAKALGLSRPTGAVVKAIHPASPAGKKGLKIGDVITQVNGREIMDPASLAYRVATLPLESEAELQILRSGKAYSLRMKLIAPPEDPPRKQQTITGHNPLSGATVANLSPAVAQEYGFKDIEKGVVITEIVEGSLAQRLGLQPGDIVAKVSGITIGEVGDLSRALDDAPRGGWRLSVVRDGQTLTMLLRGG